MGLSQSGFSSGLSGNVLLHTSPEHPVLIAVGSKA